MVEWPKREFLTRRENNIFPLKSIDVRSSYVRGRICEKKVMKFQSGKNCTRANNINCTSEKCFRLIFYRLKKSLRKSFSKGSSRKDFLMDGNIFKRNQIKSNF